jgi:SAM-dependent methyltransferase
MAGIKISRRDKCRVCGSGELFKWVHLPQMPLTDDLRQPGSGDEFLHDIDVYQCCDCHTSQLLHDMDYSSYYVDYNYTVAGSPFVTTFTNMLAQSLFDQYCLARGSNVIEIGSGDGAQLLCFKDRGANVFGYEPSAPLCRLSESIGVPVHQGLFTESSIENIPVKYMPADVLLLTYTFDHIPEPIKFLDAAKKILNPETGLLVMEVHDLDKIMERREYCLFEHEHSIYLSGKTMQAVLKKAGFCLISTNLLPEADRRGNSLLIVAALEGSTYANNTSPLFEEESVGDDSIYQAFNEEMHKSIMQLDSFIEMQLAAGRVVAGYGAGGRGVMTLAAMDSAGKLKYLCDQNPAFHGCVTPKTHVPIVPPSTLEEDPVDVLLVFSFGYINEIKMQVSALDNAPSQVVSMLEIL